MATKPECPYCGTAEGLRQIHDGGGVIEPEYTCEDCFTATDDGPCFDDLTIAGAGTGGRCTCGALCQDIGGERCRYENAGGSKDAPVAWVFELATTIDGEENYSGWEPQLSFTKPTVSVNSIRNLRALTVLEAASAPDLLAALKEVMEWVKNWDPHFTVDDAWWETNARVEAAIARELQGRAILEAMVEA